MGTTYACQCPTTGYITYCSCGCNTCGDPCAACPTWYWWVVGAGVLVGIIIAIIAVRVRRQRRRQMQNRAIEINLNPNSQYPVYVQNPQNAQYPPNAQYQNPQNAPRTPQ